MFVASRTGLRTHQVLLTLRIQLGGPIGNVVEADVRGETNRSGMVGE
ncbi:MAG TPA: hypothetical protein VMT75_05485 [Candidatus Saccharimonadales bacterium]|nr:hypothetical protein [Candidatus Saccharimonadales bacterium]